MLRERVGSLVGVSSTPEPMGWRPVRVNPEDFVARDRGVFGLLYIRGGILDFGRA